VADANPKHKAPVSIRGKAGRIAMNFFEEAFAREGDAGVVRLERELGVLEWSVRGQPEWKAETTSPFFDLEWKRELVSKRLAAQGLSPLLTELVMDMVAKAEIRRLEQVRVDYDEIMRGYRREIDATLTTSTPLSPARLELFKRSVQNDYLTPDDKLIFAHVVDPSLGGGYKVHIKGLEHDHSWAKAVREADEAMQSLANGPREVYEKRPRPAAVNLAEAVKTVLSDKDTQGWFSSDLFARVLAQEEAELSKKPDTNPAKVGEALKQLRKGRV